MHLHSSLVLNKAFPVLVVSIIFAIFVDEILSEDQNFDACVPQDSGNGPKISYPFWIANQQESFCGHPNFKVKCNGKNPVLTVSEDDYIIKDMFYANNSFLLASTMVYDFGNTCPIPVHNFSTDGTPFDYGLGYVDLFFFYNCTSYPIDPTYPVACASNATHYSFAAFHKEILEYNNYPIESCHTSVNAPVRLEEIKKLMAMNFTDVLSKGFVLKWSEANCSDCKRSGGRALWFC